MGAVMREQQLGITQLQLVWQWNKCVKHCLNRDSSLPVTYPTLNSGWAYTKHLDTVAKSGRYTEADFLSSVRRQYERQ